jgi:DNA transformation protein and related proteins
MREWLEERLQALTEFEVRRLFGGAGLYAAGTIFGILYAGRVYLKTDDETRSAFIERGSEPFRPRQTTVLKSYFEVPPEVLDDDGELVRWAGRALQAALAAPQKPARRPRAPAPRRRK